MRRFAVALQDLSQASHFTLMPLDAEKVFEEGAILPSGFAVDARTPCDDFIHEALPVKHIEAFEAVGVKGIFCV